MISFLIKKTVEFKKTVEYNIYLFIIKTYLFIEIEILNLYDFRNKHPLCVFNVNEDWRSSVEDNLKTNFRKKPEK